MEPEPGPRWVFLAHDHTLLWVKEFESLKEATEWLADFMPFSVKGSLLTVGVTNSDEFIANMQQAASREVESFIADGR